MTGEVALTRVQSFAISLDGFGTGEGQSLEAPFGHADDRLHEWMFATRWGREMLGQPGGSLGFDDALVRQFPLGIGAEIMGANKFGHPGWHEDPDWTGWWGPNPPFHTPVIVLTHHVRPPIEMEGGTTFHFVDASPAEALATAREAAGGQTFGSAAASRPFATSWWPDSSIRCTSSSSRSCSAAAFDSGTAWRASSVTTRSRASPRQAASPT